MTTFFLVCAGLGSLVLVLQLLVGAVFSHESGFGHHEDDGGMLFGVLSVRALSAALGAFGLAGYAGLSSGGGLPTSVGLAVVTGGAMMALIVGLMRSLRRLSASGTIDTAKAVDQIGTIYIPVPGNYEGQGKVQLDVMNRTVELAAVTFGPALTTGTRVRVVQLVDAGTAEVVGVGLG